MTRNISDAVRELCLALPEVTEVSAHGSPDFRVGRKTFATYVVNHHGDGRVALWLNAPAGAQALYVDAEPQHFFVPPYVGPRGWLGVHLDRGLDWRRIGALVREAYVHVAPAPLSAAMAAPADIEPPTEGLDAETLNPMAPAHVQAILARLRDRCLALPETSETRQFGNPAWRAGKKTFCTANRYQRRLQLLFWVGAERQAMLTFDDRYQVPAYMGHNGWISLDAEEGVLWDEVEALLADSYRHFALKRMLRQLDAVEVAS